MSLTKNTPVEALLQAGLEHRVRAQVVKKLVDKHLEAARKELTKTLEDELVNFSVGSVEKFRDMARACDQYEIRAFLNEEELTSASKE